MKKSHKLTGNFFLTVLFLSTSSFMFSQSAYSEPVKEKPKTTTTTSAKMETKSKYSKEDQAMIDFYSDPKNAKEVEKTANAFENIKPMGDGFYTVTELDMTYKAIVKKFDVFQEEYKSPHTDAERISLLNGIIASYEKANQEATKAKNASSAYSESDKTKVAKYSGYYPKVLSILNEMLEGRK